ncbi:hypothetical protein AGMMS49928_25680 [Spirochaetia bacterium]|nr:hypothetical protein AGMMS49928_25680 [Spirochaetia bacterium]
MHEDIKITISRLGPPRFVLFLLLAFAAGGICTGLFFYKTQSALLAKYERSSKLWKTFTPIAVPTAALLSGRIVFAVTR